jgi:predicted PurR-regulated permease PerM
VGKDTGMPDYLVRISTIGGIAVMGINGFVVGPVIAAMFVAIWGIQTTTRARAAAASAAAAHAEATAAAPSTDAPSDEVRP